jgi:hypothetical protein
MYEGAWRRILHDSTADSLARAISRLSHANVTTVPFHFDDDGAPAADELSAPEPSRGNGHHPPAGVSGMPPPRNPDGTTPIGSVQWRRHVKVRGRVNALRVEPLAGSPSVEYTVADASGGLSVVFFGRRQIAGVQLGTVLTVEGMAIDHHGRLAIVNPVYELG